MIQSKSGFIWVITTLERDDEEEVCLNLSHNRGPTKAYLQALSPTNIKSALACT